jgi:AbrB family looped-hinge helix DNA binding protein
VEPVTVPAKFQIVIPRAVRKVLGIRPGQKTKVILHKNRIELIPQKPIQQTRGFQGH